MSEDPTQSEGGALDRFLRLRASLIEAPADGRTEGSGGGIGRALTAALDDGVRALLPEPPPGVALVALGGYGREELCLFSDVDLMVLHRLSDPGPVAARVFRPLWDARLRLGHSVRTVEECLKGARERFDVFTTLLTGRFLTGDRALFDDLEGRIARVVKARPLRRYLVTEEMERRRRSPYLLMSADVKSGRGGLRTLHAFDWENRRQQLIGRFAPDPGEVADDARETLLAIRNGLHAAAGRAHDTFDFDLRAAVADWLGSSVTEVSQRLVDAMVTVDRLASARWPEIRSSSGGWRGSKRRELEPASLTAGTFADLLRRGESGRFELDSLWVDGHLDDVLPVWGRVRTRPHIVPFHDHPVAHHLWRTVDEMQRLVEGDGEEAEIARQVGSIDLLTLAAFLHDIGKGSGADHSESGAEIARAICSRLGCDAVTMRTVVAAVRHHLLLADTVARRDIEDPNVVNAVASRLGELRTLRTVYLLTIADSRATGASMFPAWKHTRLRKLYEKVRDALETRGVATSLDEPAGWPTEESEHHLAAMPDDYTQNLERSQLELHLSLARDLEGDLAVDVQIQADMDIFTMVAADRPRLREMAAQCLAAGGFDILEARLATRTDGVVFDTFHVRDHRPSGTDRVERWDRLREDLQRSLTGESSPSEKVRARAGAYPSPGPAREQVVVEAGPDAMSGELTISVRCPDVIGRLAEILGILEELHLEIRLAKVDVRGGEVVDTFHLRSRPDDLDLRILEREIASRIS